MHVEMLGDEGHVVLRAHLQVGEQFGDAQVAVGELVGIRSQTVHREDSGERHDRQAQAEGGERAAQPDGEWEIPKLRHAQRARRNGRKFERV